LVDRERPESEVPPVAGRATDGGASFDISPAVPSAVAPLQAPCSARH